MTQEKEIIHELIFDFVNGKTKRFKFETQEKALAIIGCCKSKNTASTKLEGSIIFLCHVCSITYNSYPKPEENNE